MAQSSKKKMTKHRKNRKNLVKRLKVISENRRILKELSESNCS